MKETLNNEAVLTKCRLKYAQMLIAERDKLAKALDEINRELEVIDRRRLQDDADHANEQPIDNEYDPHETTKTPRSNILSKVQAMKQALETAVTPLPPKELVQAMVRLGYTFASRNPANTLNPYLYGSKKLPWIKKFGCGLILATREGEFEQLVQSKASVTRTESTLKVPTPEI
jgi:hypothetical protein